MSSSRARDDQPTDAWLIRHGDSIGHGAGALLGQLDAPLTEVGRSQAAALASAWRARQQSFAALFTSDLARASSFAAVLAHRLELPVATEPKLREVNIGAWSGLTPTEIAARFPTEWDNWTRHHDPTHQRGGGESYLELQQRVVPAVLNIAANFRGQQVLVITHGRCIASFVLHILDAPLSEMWRLRPAPASITRVRLFSDRDSGRGELLAFGSML